MARPVAALIVALMTAAGASAASARAATPTFSAHGSAEQVYVTGLAPNARMSLLSPNGTTLYTQQADSLGGLLFRNVPPGSGYRVRSYPGGVESGPITVHSDAAAPWDPEHLQPVDPRQTAAPTDHPGRHPTRDRRAPADGAGRRSPGSRSAFRFRRAVESVLEPPDHPAWSARL